MESAVRPDSGSRILAREESVGMHLRSERRRRAFLWCATAGWLLALGQPGAGSAQELCPCPPPPPPPPLWTGSAGLSYLANSGNSDNESLGFTVSLARQPTPWG